MSRRKKTSPPPALSAKPAEVAPVVAGTGGAPRPGPALRALVAAASRAERQHHTNRLLDEGLACECVHVDSAVSAWSALAEATYDIALVSEALADGAGLELVGALSRRPGCPAPVLVCAEATLDLAVRAMRLGAADIVPLTASAKDLAAAVKSAAARSAQNQFRQARIEKLTRVCRKLNQARHEVTRQVSSLCGDMVTAYQELAGQVTQLEVASEFSSLIRQELDVESVLRTALEYVLAKTGPTNAAVFLPSAGCDWSLGAYVNYDVAKDNADMLLEHLAAIVPPRVQDEHELKSLCGRKELESFFAEDAHWLGDSRVIVFACHHEGECLGAVILFRDRRSPFADTLIPTLKIVAQLFGRQLARVVHVHHRHLPKDQWGGFGVPEDDDDDIDLAA
jgi:DNA-binding response OmpR family regulator